MVPFRTGHLLIQSLNICMEGPELKYLRVIAIGVYHSPCELTQEQLVKNVDSVSQYVKTRAEVQCCGAVIMGY